MSYSDTHINGLISYELIELLDYEQSEDIYIDLFYYFNAFITFF